MSRHGDLTPATADELETGYAPELKRGLNLWSTFAIGFATVSPVVGIYAVVSLGYITSGPSWVWVVPLVLILQLTVASVYAELASQWPIAGGCYQWVRRLAGDSAGWFTGFLYLASGIASLSTVSYLGGAWLYRLITGHGPAPGAQVLCGAAFLLLALVLNQLGVNPLKWFLNAGVIAEAVASIGVGLALLFFFRNHPFSLLFEGPASGAASAGFWRRWPSAVGRSSDSMPVLRCRRKPRTPTATCPARFCGRPRWLAWSCC
jgi:amino acid transporter